MQLPTDAIAIRHVLQALEHVADGCARVDWNKRSADSLSQWRVISAGADDEQTETRQSCRVQFERCGTSHDFVAQYISLLLQAHPKMAGTVVVE